MDFIKYLSQPDPALPANKRRLLTTGGIQVGGWLGGWIEVVAWRG